MSLSSRSAARHRRKCPDSAALHALHGWDFIKKLLWCIISTLLNSSDTSFHKSLLGCQVRLTWRSCNSIAATRLVRHAATGIVLLYCQPKHEWSEFHSCSISWLYIVTFLKKSHSETIISVVLLQGPNTNSFGPRLRDGKASFSRMKQQEQFVNYIMNYKLKIQ